MEMSDALKYVAQAKELTLNMLHEKTVADEARYNEEHMLELLQKAEDALVK